MLKPRIQAPKAIRILRKVVRRLAEEDSEFVEGGCADVSFFLAELCKKAGITAILLTGDAVFADGGRCQHVWMEVQGVQYDPVYFFSGVRPRSYDPKPYSITDHFGVDTEMAHWQMDDLWKEFGGELSLLASAPVDANS